MKFDCKPTSKGRWCLEQLAAGSMSRPELLERAERRFERVAEVKGIPQTLGALQACRLINFDRRRYVVLPEGREVLTRLQAGETVHLEPVPGSLTPKVEVTQSVRIFAQEKAA